MSQNEVYIHKNYPYTYGELFCTSSRFCDQAYSSKSHMVANRGSDVLLGLTLGNRGILIHHGPISSPLRALVMAGKSASLLADVMLSVVTATCQKS